MEEIDAWHVYPTNDLEKHVIEGTTCKCNPEVKVTEEGLLVIHNSFDGREGVELANEILKTASL